MLRLCKNARYLLIRICGNSFLLYTLLRQLEAFEELLVEKDTQICIEGFPRSANSFMTLFFSHWNPDVKTAHHAHLPVQIRIAARRKIPAIVVIRPPLDAIVSLLVREKNLYPWVAIKTYILFYKMIEQYRSYFILADFETCITRPDRIVDLANKKFNTSFNNGILNEELNVSLFANIDYVNKLNSGDETTTSRPSGLKENLKDELRAQISRHRLYETALRTYQSLLPVD